MKNKLFTKGAIIEMIIAALCIAGGLVIIVFNIIIYPKFKTLIYSIIGLFLLALILAAIAVQIILKYRNLKTYIENNEPDNQLDYSSDEAIAASEDNTVLSDEVSDTHIDNS